MSIVADIVLSAIGESPSSEGAYAMALKKAFTQNPPPFGTNCYGAVYRNAAKDPAWVAESLLAGAESEAEGAGHLWGLAASSSNAHVAAHVKQHAIDESRHARWYIATTDLAFPGAIEERLRLELASLAPRFAEAEAPRAADYVYSDPTLDHFVQANLAEIRTWVNQKLQMPVLMAYCDPARHRRLRVLLDRLARDEIRHIEYTAALINRFAARESSAMLDEVMQQRTVDLNAITHEQVGARIYPLHCSAGRCGGDPDLPAGCPLATPIGQSTSTA